VTDAAGPAGIALVGRRGLPAALEAHRALGAGLDVLLTDDGLDTAHEAAMKARAARLGRLALGPGAGLMHVDGVALGFANALDEGPVGIVSASGSAARLAGTGLAAAGVGVAACYVTGPRDLTAEVGGAGFAAAVERLRRDPEVRVVVAVPWPGDAAVVAGALEALTACRRPVVAWAPGGALPASPEVAVALTVEAAVAEAAALVGREALPPGPQRPRWVSGGLVRGLFCGAGTAGEAAGVLAERLTGVVTNAGAPEPLPVGAADRAHAALDLGDPVLRGALPHPMLDPHVRRLALAEAAAEHRVHVVLLDVPLGYGLHPDPAGALAEPVGALLRGRPQVTVVAHVVGTERDPQGLAGQERRLADLGVRVVPSVAAAARLAIALVGT
jgi:FdrA protein